METRKIVFKRKLLRFLLLSCQESPEFELSQEWRWSWIICKLCANFMQISLEIFGTNFASKVGKRINNVCDYNLVKIENFMSKISILSSLCVNWLVIVQLFIEYFYLCSLATEPMHKWIIHVFLLILSLQDESLSYIID